MVKMPRVAGNGPFRRGSVWSNNSSDDETSGHRPPSTAWRSDEADPNARFGQASNALFEQYLQAGRELGDDLGKDQVFEMGLTRIREHLTGVDSSCCLICLNHISTEDSVWSCERGCYTALHLNCIQEWARSQVDAARTKAAARLTQFPLAAEAAGASAEWGCPKCRSTYPAADIPRHYKCFCGKAENPVFDPWITPHSCGEVCGRPLSGGCGHSCLLLCHPGPCPPCPLVVDASCYCGRKRLKRRCGHHEFTCEDVCGRKFECGHKCPDVCHPEECATCRVMGDFRCRCGAERRRLPCGERVFQCDRVCGKPLACGNHVCELVCHAGACGQCPFSGKRTCPCGKKSYQGMSCADRVATCDETCGKLLSCGVHRCMDRCHYGDCTQQCRGPVFKTCRCGKSQKEVLCFQEFTCERRCAALRACGRHPCKRRCCDGTCPPCEEVCGRRLKCGNHKCPAPCHSGPCRPCPLTVTVMCACGTTRATLRCGAESTAQPPQCPAPCSVPRICRHGPQLEPHPCHFGPCPTCPFSCGTPLLCGHTCSVAGCHDPLPPPIPDFQPPPPPKAAVLNGELSVRGGPGTAPAVQQPAQLARQMLAEVAATGQLPSACPPCRQQVPVECVGGHGKRTTPCCEQRPYSCGAPCGRLLQCGNHTCSLQCHAVVQAGWVKAASAGGQSADITVPRPCRQCDRRCEVRRSCGHPCPLPCHKGPCLACEVQTRKPCMCGKATLNLPCREMSLAMGSGGLSCGKPCHRQLAFCTHPCKALCHTGSCPNPEDCSAEVNVRCGCPAKRRAKWKCSEVQAALVKAGKPRMYDDAQAPRLLPCDKECEVAAKTKRGKDAASVIETRTVEKSPEEPESGSGTAAAQGKAKTRLTRADREALAAKKEAERLRAERLRAVIRGVVLGVVVLLGVLLAWGVKAFLAQLDQKAQQLWAPDAV